MRSNFVFVAVCVAGLLALGCAGSDGADGADGSDGTDGLGGDDGVATLVNVTPEAPGETCADGGVKVESGRDDDGDNTLAPDEIDSTTYVCNGVNGEDGSLLRVTAEPRGENCEFGGTKIEAGMDDDGDGALGDTEVDTTDYVCEDCVGPDCTLIPDIAQSAETETCLGCHETMNPGMVDRWYRSDHYLEAVGCYECHQAEASDVDAMNHNGETIAVIVSPTDCARCHSAEVDEFEASHHSAAGDILDSLDNRLAEIIEGDLSFEGESPAAVSGCAQCHGSVVVVEAGGGLSAATFPNSGIGRLNPDGSRGACSACHMRHDFSVEVARRPENCGRCHMGPDHPHIEVYEESQHGILFHAHEDEMALDSDSWVVGVDYTAAPTCATCHMGETRTQPLTHDVGTRLSWNLRAPISFETTDSAAKRGLMQDVCSACHSAPHIENFYEQLEAGVNLYNNKFAQPATDIYNAIRAPFAGAGAPEPLISTPTFDDELEWSYFYLWHHEGRRARAGLAMLGPDYTQWHGFYEVAERFYFEVIPQAREILEHHLDTTSPDYDARTDARATAIQVQIHDVLCRPEHLWFGETGCL